MSQLPGKSPSPAVQNGGAPHRAGKLQFPAVQSLVPEQELSVIGRWASILASMQAFQEYSAGVRQQHANEFARRVRAGEFKGSEEKLGYLNRFRAVLTEEEASWRRLQVSVVAGAGFEPAAFRL